MKPTIKSLRLTSRSRKRGGCAKQSVLLHNLSPPPAFIPCIGHDLSPPRESAQPSVSFAADFPREGEHGKESTVAASEGSHSRPKSTRRRRRKKRHTTLPGSGGSTTQHLVVLSVRRGPIGSCMDWPGRINSSRWGWHTNLLDHIGIYTWLPIPTFCSPWVGNARLTRTSFIRMSCHLLALKRKQFTRGWKISLQLKMSI